MSQKGNQVVMKKTAKGRFRRTLQAIKEWGMEHRHLPMKEQQRKLNEKLRGHDGYYGVTGNIRMLSRLRYEVAKLWQSCGVGGYSGATEAAARTGNSSRACCVSSPYFLLASYTPKCNETTTPRNRMR
jgi:hypothetical protein